MFDFMQVVKALADENRVRILLALQGHELCVCQVTGLLDLAPSTTSKHLSILRQARLIEGRKKSKWVYYTLADAETAPTSVQEALRWLFASLEHDPVALEDKKRIARILEKECEYASPEERNSMRDNYHSLEIHALAETEDERA